MDPSNRGHHSRDALVDVHPIKVPRCRSNRVVSGPDHPPNAVVSGDNRNDQPSRPATLNRLAPRSMGASSDRTPYQGLEDSPALDRPLRGVAFAVSATTVSAYQDEVLDVRVCDSYVRGLVEDGNHD